MRGLLFKDLLYSESGILLLFLLSHLLLLFLTILVVDSFHEVHHGLSLRSRSHGLDLPQHVLVELPFNLPEPQMINDLIQFNEPRAALNNLVKLSQCLMLCLDVVAILLPLENCLEYGQHHHLPHGEAETVSHGLNLLPDKLKPNESLVREYEVICSFYGEQGQLVVLDHLAFDLVHLILNSSIGYLVKSSAKHTRNDRGLSTEGAIWSFLAIGFIFEEQRLQLIELDVFLGLQHVCQLPLLLNQRPVAAFLYLFNGFLDVSLLTPGHRLTYGHDQVNGILLAVHDEVIGSHWC